MASSLGSAHCYRSQIRDRLQNAPRTNEMISKNRGTVRAIANRALGESFSGKGAAHPIQIAGEFGVDSAGHAPWHSDAMKQTMSPPGVHAYRGTEALRRSTSRRLTHRTLRTATSFECGRLIRRRSLRRRSLRRRSPLRRSFPHHRGLHLRRRIRRCPRGPQSPLLPTPRTFGLWPSSTSATLSSPGGSDHRRPRWNWPFSSCE